MRYKDFYTWLLKESDENDGWDRDEEEREEYKIKGEYWIQEGSIQFADGDVGDYNHESIVILHAKRDVFNYLDINADPEANDFESLVEQALRREDMEISEDYDLEEAFYNYVKNNFSKKEADKARELYRAATDRTDLRMFAKKHWGWIWVRGNDVGVYELTPQTIKYLVEGIDQIISDSGDEDVLDEDVYLFIGVDKTKKHYHEPLSKLREGRFGMSSTKADNVKKTDVVDKLDKAIQHPFYKDRVDENYLIKSDEETRITPRFRHVTDPEEIETIQSNYGYYARRAGIHETDLSNYISSGWGVVYKPYGSESATVGQFIGDVYAVSHYAPESDKEGIKMLLDLLHTSTPVVFAVPHKLSKQLERIGYKKEATGVPMYFKGELMEKDIMVNNAMRREDLASLLYHWMEESKNNHILSEHPKVKEFFSKIENLNNKKLNENVTSKQIVYHGTSLPLKKFDPKKTAQGIIWFSSNKDSIISGSSGAQSSKYILTCELSGGKYAGWREYKKLSLGELKGDGFKGAILPDTDGFDGFVFNPNDLKIIKIETNAI